MQIRRFAAAAAMLLCAQAWADAASPVGLWKTIDDHTGKPTALIRIVDAGGELSGRVERLFRAAGEPADPVCDKCEGARRGQPILGMTILSGMTPEGAEFAGGQILDPANGKTYRSKMRLVDGGKKLDVRGYIGLPAFGRTQTWIRDE